MALTRDAILGADDLARETVPAPEWGGEVVVRALMGFERDEFEESMFTGRGKDRRANFANLRARLVALAVVDAAGKRLFTDADAAALGKKNAAVLDRVFSVAQRLSGLSAADVEELAGNSAPSPHDGT